MTVLAEAVAKATTSVCVRDCPEGQLRRSVAIPSFHDD